MRVIMRLFYLFLVNLFGMSVAYAQWTAKYTHQMVDGLPVAIIQFKKNEQRLEYQPTQFPLTVVDVSVSHLDGQDYIISASAYGARSLLYRIFAPETHGNTPLCEEISFMESTTLRRKNGQLEIEVLSDFSIENPQTETMWVSCAHSSDKNQSNDIAKQLAFKYGIVTGNYQLIKGNPEECITGEYQIVKGDNTYSLFADGGIMAMRLQDSEYKDFAENCHHQYRNAIVNKVFQNRESIDCPKESFSTYRSLDMTFEKPFLSYTLVFHNLSTGNKLVNTCQLKLKE